jgi:hypothetical protein
MGYQIQAIFKVTLYNKDYDLLSQIQAYFGVGKITKHGNTTLQYMIRSPLRQSRWGELQIIINHFVRSKISFIKSKIG